MKVITADIFLKHWLDFSQTLTSNGDWLTHWQSSTAWSNYILGTKRSSSKTSPIGEFFRRHFDKLRYRTEDGLYDLTMSLSNNFTDIPTLDRNYNLIAFQPKTEEYYPTIYDILLEHENEIYYSWHEIAKLGYVRGLLKVLVTYNSDNLTKQQIANECAMMVKTFSTVIKQCNSNFSDNSQTEYLLLVGRQEADELVWFHQTFDDNGNERK
jgi:hypothetical protein